MTLPTTLPAASQRTVVTTLPLRGKLPGFLAENSIRTVICMENTKDGAAMDLERFTSRELLSHVDAAIQNILVGGQSYRLGNRSLTRADLGLLRQMRNELLAQEDTGDGCLLPGTVVAFFESR